jgi:hypothetical protein
LACGVPALISSVAPFAYFVERHQCGVVFEPTPRGLVAAVEDGMRRFTDLSASAVRTAHSFFSETLFVQKMAHMYREILV